jgi:hypothetical protein
MTSLITYFLQIGLERSIGRHVVVTTQQPAGVSHLLAFATNFTDSCHVSFLQEVIQVGKYEMPC